MCPERQQPKVWGQPLVLCCLGLRKERGRELESRQGHAAQPREGHGMWLAAGCTHSTAGLGSTELLTVPGDHPHALGMPWPDCPSPLLWLAPSQGVTVPAPAWG